MKDVFVIFVTLSFTFTTHAIFLACSRYRIVTQYAKTARALGVLFFIAASITALCAPSFQWNEKEKPACEVAK